MKVTILHSVKDERTQRYIELVNNLNQNNKQKLIEHIFLEDFFTQSEIKLLNFNYREKFKEDGFSRDFQEIIADSKLKEYANNKNPDIVIIHAGVIFYTDPYVIYQVIKDLDNEDRIKLKLRKILITIDSLEIYRESPSTDQIQKLIDLGFIDISEYMLNFVENTLGHVKTIHPIKYLLKRLKLISQKLIEKPLQYNFILDEYFSRIDQLEVKLILYRNFLYEKKIFDLTHDFKNMCMNFYLTCEKAQKSNNDYFPYESDIKIQYKQISELFDKLVNNLNDVCPDNYLRLEKIFSDDNLNVLTFYSTDKMENKKRLKDIKEKLNLYQVKGRSIGFYYFYLSNIAPEGYDVQKIYNEISSYIKEYSPKIIIVHAGAEVSTNIPNFSQALKRIKKDFNTIRFGTDRIERFSFNNYKEDIFEDTPEMNALVNLFIKGDISIVWK